MTDRKLPISLSDHSEFGINHGSAAVTAIGGGTSCLLGAGIGLPAAATPTTVLPPLPPQGPGAGIGGLGVAATAVTGVVGGGNVVGGNKHAIARLKHTNSGDTLRTT
ncbi:hypothetical protein quinque_010410 [Culex quinquefasciatus]